MNNSSRIFAYILLPMASFALVYGGAYALLPDLMQQPLQLSYVLLTAALAAGLPAALIRVYLGVSLREGYALLDNGSCRLPKQLSLLALLRGRVKGWVPFSQPLHTVICLHAREQLVCLSVHIERRLMKDLHGQQLAEKLREMLPQLEQSAQKAVQQASRADPSMAAALGVNVLLNDTDIDILKSKLLSALEMAPVPGIDYALTPQGISIDRKVVRRPLPPVEREPEEEDLDLDFSFLAELEKS